MKKIAPDPPHTHLVFTHGLHCPPSVHLLPQPSTTKAPISQPPYPSHIPASDSGTDGSELFSGLADRSPPPHAIPCWRRGRKYQSRELCFRKCSICSVVKPWSCGMYCQQKGETALLPSSFVIESRASRRLSASFSPSGKEDSRPARSACAAIPACVPRCPFVRL